MTEQFPGKHRSWNRIAAGIAAAASFATLSYIMLADAAQSGVAYVSNQEGGVSVIDLATLRETGTIDVEGKTPRGIGVTGDGRHLITANRDGGDVSVIDTASRKVIKHIPIGKNPEFVRVHGKYAYVSFEPSSKGRPPSAADETDEDNDNDRVPAEIAVIDTETWRLKRSIQSGPETEGIEFSKDGKQLLVTNEGDNTVAVYELATGKLVKTIDTAQLGIRPRGIKGSPDGQHYVVTLEYGDKFLVIGKNLEPVKTVATGKTPYGVSFDRSGQRLFVAASRENALQVFDGRTFEWKRNIPVGERCWHFTFTPDDKHILVACGRSNEVLAFNATTYERVAQLPGMALPWGIVTYPKAVGSLDTP
ncbi:MAG: beta-propeller fold lactonase family protein [Burkholderiales bacterium]